MNVRMASVDEYQFLRCLKYGVWGSNQRRIDKWNIGDMLIFSIDKKITALAEVTGAIYETDELLWDNGIYMYRLPLKFKVVLSVEDRIPVVGDIKDYLVLSWGFNYGTGIVNKRLLNEEAAKFIVEKIEDKPNSLLFFLDNIDRLIQDVNYERELEFKKQEDPYYAKSQKKYKNKQFDLE